MINIIILTIFLILLGFLSSNKKIVKKYRKIIIILFIFILYLSIVYHHHGLLFIALLGYVLVDQKIIDHQRFINHCKYFIKGDWNKLKEEFSDKKENNIDLDLSNHGSNELSNYGSNEYFDIDENEYENEYKNEYKNEYENEHENEYKTIKNNNIDDDVMPSIYNLMNMDENLDNVIGGDNNEPENGHEQDEQDDNLTIMMADLDNKIGNILNHDNE